ncbi:E3 ubiquitin protein ligase DRIP2-like isoform X1 [Iris pallida]|uniref:E3 ubiquitin protein ligase DRIP2-like isoform X1 n=1 Tax=Iris pallida TaxID=29817 RepID=A0AAX6EAE1_IRIPA|nr:E3 ubiquitin protein ligase DRIP2-like isoform X1 [Iris pallida]KAJ6841074.1 E3 ubiquitin protein ligase DRIP2-like isoform X1 [Iris pallida]
MAAAARRKEAVRVRREVLAACVTCPLCEKLLRHATTISECLHTFCRKCILEKLTEEEVECCPICNIDLGCLPLEKLRPDHCLQDLRAKIFPFKRRKVEAPELPPSLALPARRKERSLSSIVVDTPRLASQTGLRGRRSRILTRRAAALRRLSPDTNDPTKKEGNKAEDHSGNSSSLEILIKKTQNRRQNSSSVEPSDRVPKKDSEDGGDSFTDNSELWKHLVEAANGTRALKLGSQSPGIMPEQINGPDSELHIHESRVREHQNKPNIQDDENSSTPNTPATVKVKRRRKRKNLRTSVQALIDAASATRDSRSNPIWLSLIPTFDQQQDPKSPQTFSCYLRIKDVTLPVSFIHKYLAKKLSLLSEAEVVIECQGQQVNPTSLLHNLADIWLRHGPVQRLQASIGSPGKDFVIVLNYSCKAPGP